MKLDLNLTDFLKLPIKIMASLSLGSGLLLFLPEFIIKKLYMVSFREEYGFIIGIIFVISFVIFVVSICVTYYDYLSTKKAKKKFLAGASKRLDSFNEYQKVIVYSLYQKDNHTEELPINDGAVRILEHNMVIQKAATQYAVSDLNNAVFPYFIQPWVVDELQANPTLLESFSKAYDNYEQKIRRGANDDNFYY